jgi:Fic family protein
MSMDLLNEIHSVLTEKTVDSEGKTPVLRDDKADPRPLYVQDNIKGLIYHKAPKSAFAKEELKKLIHFANNETEGFLHPVIKAAMLHFWIGYLHPYTDGNGRLARVVFYWYLLKHEYWAFAYLPIAAKIKSGGKVGYTMVYVYSEQDDYDLTYFISYLLRKATETYKEFQKYVESTRKTNKKVALAARTKFNLNDRQIQLLKYLSADSNNSTRIASYQSFNGISRATAINDLQELSSKGFARKQKVGRVVFYLGTDAILKLFEQS